MSITAINVRNQFRGKVKAIVEGPVVSEIDVEAPSGLIVTSGVPMPSMSPQLSTSMLSRRFTGAPVRVLIIPGLNDSGPTHWQTWLQSQYQGAVRVKQQRWQDPDLDAWAARIDQVVSKSSTDTLWIAVAHSFGCLALTRHLATRAPMSVGGIRSALLVAPADPGKFGLTHRIPQQGLGIPTCVVGSDTDPWMPAERARAWAQQWGSRFHNLGDAGHINVESGHGPWPWARYKTDQMIRDQQRERRLERAHPLELHYAV